MMSFTKPSNVCLTRARLALSHTARRQRGQALGHPYLALLFLRRRSAAGNQPANLPTSFGG
jgi:hypothetical protein